MHKQAPTLPPLSSFYSVIRPCGAAATWPVRVMADAPPVFPGWITCCPDAAGPVTD
ncbi:MAG: hypothetical protein PsegKO_17230 [Pseudohongiellaceae bacterium]